MQKNVRNELLSFVVANNLPMITAKFEPQEYLLEKEVNLNLDISNLHHDLSSNEFQILTQSPQLTKIQIGDLTLEFNNVKELNGKNSRVLRRIDNLVHSNEQCFLNKENSPNTINKKQVPKDLSQELLKSKIRIAQLESLVKSLTLQNQQLKNSKKGNLHKKNRQVKQTFQVGFATFNAEIQKNRKLWMVAKHKKKMLKQMDWAVELDTYEGLNWSEVFPYIKEASCRQLHIKFAETQTLTLESILTRPHFNRLTELILRGNNLQSIEMLNFIRADHLKFLSLDDNHLVISKSFHKNNWKQLSKIYTKGNYFLQVDFGRMRFNEAVQELELNYSYKESVVIENLASIAKMEARSMNETIKMENRMRLVNIKVEQALQRRYQNAFEEEIVVEQD